MKRWILIVVAVLAAGCADRPRAPQWQVNAHDALARYTQAYLEGNERVAEAEFKRAVGELARTGQPGLVARAELTRCAAALASLVIEPCTGFERLRQDALEPERAYADFLAGRITPAQAQLLPPQYHDVAAGREDIAAVRAIADPLSRLIASGVLLRSGRANPEVIALAADTATHEGWARPLLAWLGVQAQRAERAGAQDEAARIRRRMDTVSSGARP